MILGSHIRTVIGRRIEERAEQDARKKGVNSVKTMLGDGDPATMIVDPADRENPDLPMMGSRGLSGIRELFMGSVSHKVSYSAPCSVVIVKAVIGEDCWATSTVGRRDQTACSVLGLRAAIRLSEEID